jgi:predicted PurR-regulated permease PerM
MKGVMAYIFVFIVAFVLTVMTFMLFIPLSTNMIHQFANAGEQIISQVNDTENPELKQNLNDAIQGLRNSEQILAFFVKYSWIFIIIVVVFTLFMFARSQVEYPEYVIR